MSLEDTGSRRRSPGDWLLFGVTAIELVLLFWLTGAFTPADWIYVLQHVIVLGVALTRPLPLLQDRSPASGVAVFVAYTYPYAQVACLQFAPGDTAAPDAGIVLVVLAAFLSLASLATLGRRFGVRPALRGLATGGPYRVVRHPMYLSYLLADTGYNLIQWSPASLALVAAGWAALVYRIRAEERVLAHDAGWNDFAARVRYRLVPGVW